MKPNEHFEKALSLLQPLILDAHEMVLKKKAKPKDSRFRSHFNGDPYFEPGEQWPTVSVKKQVQPYDFIFQVVNDGTFGLPKNIAVFQFYYNWDLGPWDTESKGWLVKTYSKIDRENGITIASPVVREEDWEKEDRKYCDVTFEPIRVLPCWYTIENDGTKKEIANLVKELEKLKFDQKKEYGLKQHDFEIYDQLCHKLQVKTDALSYYGGYPRWVQYPEAKGHKFAFEIEGEAAGLYDGVFYLFFDGKNDGKFQFVAQYS